MSDDIPEELQGRGFDILRTGRWWIAEVEDPCVAVQGESREEALDKLVKRVEEYEGHRQRLEEYVDLHSCKS